MVNGPLTILSWFGPLLKLCMSSRMHPRRRVDRFITEMDQQLETLIKGPFIAKGIVMGVYGAPYLVSYQGPYNGPV